MTIAATSLSPLDLGQLSVMRVRSFIVALVPPLAAIGPEIVIAETWFPNGVVIGAAILVALWLVIVAPPRRFRHWRYAFTGQELHIARGWWTRIHTIVPIGRVQHIDLKQGPIERYFGIATLVVHTAGTEHSRVDVPGLSRARAEAIRDEIRASIAAHRE